HSPLYLYLHSFPTRRSSDLLIYFHYLAESLSFTDTATHFFVSQPSISTAVKRLETEFNTSLIDRRKTLKKMELTPAGKILYKNTDRKSTRLNSSHVSISYAV